MQTRAVTGTQFEKDIENKLWVRRERKPKMVWDVPGKNVFDKIKNVNYDVTKFNLSEESILSKYDFVYHNNDALTFEVKRYETSKLHTWTLYSEPFFKVATDSGKECIDKTQYNQFVKDFYNQRKDILDKVLESISNNLGIRCLDGFIAQHKLEYKIEIVKGWGGYDRLTVLFRIKE
jgi:hypothetical protein